MNQWEKRFWWLFHAASDGFSTQEGWAMLSKEEFFEENMLEKIDKYIEEEHIDVNSLVSNLKQIEPAK